MEGDIKREQCRVLSPCIEARVVRTSHADIPTSWQEEKKQFEAAALSEAKDYHVLKEKYDSEQAPTETPKTGNPSKAKKDPNAPKKPKTSFFLFCDAQREDVKGSNPEAKSTQIAQELASRWKALDKVRELPSFRRGSL